jgi:4-amino-4-deoxy-L-arabinose transferase-like glycosyltransferase
MFLKQFFQQLGEGKSRYVYYFLIVSIFVGIFVRFWGIGEPWLEGDEPLTIISGIKLNHDGNPYDPRLYLYENPPVGRWFTGLPTRFIGIDYSLVLSIPLNMYVYSYFAPFKEVYIPMRLVSAIFGTISVLAIFLISQRLFGLKAGIWTAVLASLSFDLIFYSRWTLTEIMFVGLALLSVCSYVFYLQSKTQRRFIYMIVSIIFFTLALGTRSFTPLMLAPILLISQFLIKRGRVNLKENVIFTVMLVAGIYVFLSVIYPPEVRNLAQQLHVVFSPFDILGFSLQDVILVNIFRNSYLYLFSLLLLTYWLFVFLREKKESGGNDFSLKPLLNYAKSSAPSIVIVVFILICIIGFTFTKYAQPRYQVLLFLPLFVLGGKTIEKFGKNKLVLTLAVVLVAVNLLFFAKAYPYYSEYQNFSVEKCGGYMISCSTTGWQNHITELKQVETYFEELDNPPIMTNEFNLLTFYNGETTPLIASQETRCEQATVQSFTNKYKYIVYWGSRGGQTDIKTDPYVCQYLSQLPMELVMSLGNYTNLGSDPESLKVKVYRINV